jgi:predicted DsbA family dithiol-disulfide isomerase
VTTPDAESLMTIKRSLLIAEKLGIQGTPATLIGEGLLPGWVPFEQFDEMVSDALKKVELRGRLAPIIRRGQ